MYHAQAQGQIMKYLLWQTYPKLATVMERKWVYKFGGGHIVRCARNPGAWLSSNLGMGDAGVVIDLTGALYSSVALGDLADVWIIFFIGYMLIARSYICSQ